MGGRRSVHQPAEIVQISAMLGPRGKRTRVISRFATIVIAGDHE
jgi:hypothetical protein